MNNLLVELSEMARQVTAQLDTRTLKLETLLKEADEKIQLLKRSVHETPIVGKIKRRRKSPGNQTYRASRPESRSAPSRSLRISRPQSFTAADRLPTEPAARRSGIDSRPPRNIALIPQKCGERSGQCPPYIGRRRSRLPASSLMHRRAAFGTDAALVFCQVCSRNANIGRRGLAISLSFRFSWTGSQKRSHSSRQVSQTSSTRSR